MKKKEFWFIYGNAAPPSPFDVSMMISHEHYSADIVILTNRSWHTFWVKDVKTAFLSWDFKCTWFCESFLKFWIPNASILLPHSLLLWEVFFFLSKKNKFFFFMSLLWFDLVPEVYWFRILKKGYLKILASIKYKRQSFDAEILQDKIKL